MDCMVTKFQRVDEANSTWLQFIHGISFADINEVLYEDYMGLAFTHPEDSSLAAVSSVVDDGTVEHDVLLEILEQEFDGHADEELLQQVDTQDIEVHVAKMRDIVNLQEHLRRVNETGDRFLNPLQVVDTDYDNFLLTFRCEEEFRVKDEDHDSLMREPEAFRVMVERDNLNISHLHALQTQIEDADNEDFEKFLELLKANIAGGKNDLETLEEELRLFLEVDENHIFHFDFYNPTVEAWQNIRELYLLPLRETYDEEVDFEQPQWFHRLDYILYLRNGHNYTELQLHDYLEKMREIVPGFLFEYTHVEVAHSSEHCLEGDIFEHENRSKFDQLLKVAAEKGELS